MYVAPHNWYALWAWYEVRARKAFDRADQALQDGNENEFHRLCTVGFDLRFVAETLRGSRGDYKRAISALHDGMVLYRARGNVRDRRESVICRRAMRLLQRKVGEEYAKWSGL